VAASNAYLEASEAVKKIPNNQGGGVIFVPLANKWGALFVLEYFAQILIISEIFLFLFEFSKDYSLEMQ
jgi:hypothetical protein